MDYLQKILLLNFLIGQHYGGEEGQKILQSLNNINSAIADNYQGGENEGE